MENCPDTTDQSVQENVENEYAKMNERVNGARNRVNDPGIRTSSIFLVMDSNVQGLTSTQLLMILLLVNNLS